MAAFKVFNKFFSSFLKDIKTFHEDLRTLVKAHYKIVDKTSAEYCDFFIEHVLCEPFAELKAGNFGDIAVAQSIPLQLVLEKAPEAEKTSVLNYFYTLLLFAHLQKLQDEELFKKAVAIYSHIQNGELDRYVEEKEDILDDDVRDIFDLIMENTTKKTTDLFESMGDSKLASLAKEISKDIDISDLNLNDVKPEEMLKSMFGGGTNNNVLGNIVQKVSSSLNDKISNGELKHEELLGEAMSMMKMFGGGNNPLFSNLAKSMKKGKTQMRSDVFKKQDTRERLKKRLEERKSTQ